jgi:hypothetical protein
MLRYHFELASKGGLRTANSDNTVSANGDSLLQLRAPGAQVSTVTCTSHSEAQ